MADEKDKKPVVEAPKPAPPPPDGGQKVPAGAPKDVPIAAAPEPDDDDDGGDSGSGETRQDRKNARAGRLRAAEEEARRAREDALLAKAQLEAQKVHIEGLRGVLPQAPSQTDQQLEQISKQQDALLKGWQGRQASLRQGEQISEEEANRTRGEWQRLADQRARLIAQSVSPQMQGPSPQQIQGMIQEAQLRAKYPDVYGAPEALAFASALAVKYQREGKVGPEAVDQVMSETRRRLGMGKHANGHSMDIDAQRYGGVPTGAAPMRAGPTSYRMSSAEQKMAYAAYPKDAPEVAEKKWAEKTGKRILAKQAK